MGKRVMEVAGKRRRGRPKRRWLDNIKNDLSERELSGEETQDRVSAQSLTSFRKHLKTCLFRRHYLA